jgi:rod shape-determining protein MreD
MSVTRVRGWLRDTFALRSSKPRDLSGTRLGTRPHYLLRPANPFFIWGSLVGTLLLNLFPWGQTSFVPDWLALALLFWNVHQPRRVGMGAAFVFGLLMDVHDGALFGEHALAYTLISYGAITLHRRMTWFPIGAQALHVLPLLLLAQAGTTSCRAAWAPSCGPCCRGCCSRHNGGRRSGTTPVRFSAPAHAIGCPGRARSAGGGRSRPMEAIADVTRAGSGQASDAVTAARARPPSRPSLAAGREDSSRLRLHAPSAARRRRHRRPDRRRTERAR